MSFSSIFDLWNRFNIRGILMLSLSLQVFLILCAPLRKKMSDSRIIFLLWLAYLMADWVAAFGIGLISHSQSNLSARAPQVDRALQAFWASFFLLHLSGPDTITVFSLEDSSFWRRHLFSIISQVCVAIYVLVQIFSSDKLLLIPTMLVFLAGVKKNMESTLAPYLSSLSRLRKSMLILRKSRVEAYGEIAEELQHLGLEYSNEEKANLAESIVVKHAYFFFNIFEVLISDLFYSSEECHISRKYFHKVSAVDALRVISAELHFMYGVLHTKVLAIRSKWSSIFRFIAFTEVVMAFVLFHHSKKHHLPELDVAITYILLFGEIALDVITLLILIFSDWTVAKIMHYKTRPSRQDSFIRRQKMKLYSFLKMLISAIDDIRKPRFATCKTESNASVVYMVLDTPFIFRRWSESISTCNIFSELLKENQRKMYKRNQRWGIKAFSDICSSPFHMAEKIISLFHQTLEIFIGRKLSLLATIPRYTFKEPFITDLWIFIFEEVRRKSTDARNLMGTGKVFETRGNLFLQQTWGAIHILKYVTEPTYDVSVILWHIATEICYRRENNAGGNQKREFSKILSDYMLHLLLNRPNVVSAVAGFAQINILSVIVDSIDIIRDVKDVEGICKALYEGSPDKIWVWTGTVHQGVQLAREMDSLMERKWDVMSGVWVEMLSYAAGHIKGEAHVQVLSQGGELLAFVWLLMAHFGCLCKPEWGNHGSLMFDRKPEMEVYDGNGDQEEDDSTVEAQLV